MNGMGNRLLSILGLLIALVGIVFGGNLVLVIIGYVILGLEQMIKDKEEGTASGMDEIIKEFFEDVQFNQILICLMLAIRIFFYLNMIIVAAMDMYKVNIKVFL